MLTLKENKGQKLAKTRKTCKNEGKMCKNEGKTCKNGQNRAKTCKTSEKRADK